MIIREWRARAALARADAIPHISAPLLPELKRLPGFLGVHLARRRLDGGQIEFLVLTHWQSLDAIRGFVGDDLAAAIVEPGAVAPLADFDSCVRRYEVIEEMPHPFG